jgi:hypothetical protein
LDKYYQFKQLRNYKELKMKVSDFFKTFKKAVQNSPYAFRKLVWRPGQHIRGVWACSRRRVATSQSLRVSDRKRSTWGLQASFRICWAWFCQMYHLNWKGDRFCATTYCRIIPYATSGLSSSVLYAVFSTVMNSHLYFWWRVCDIITYTINKR